MKIRCFNIEYDLDEDEDGDDLPTEIIVECEEDDLDDETYLVDRITDRTGFYVLDHEHEFIAEDA